MRPSEQDHWRSEVLDEVLVGLAASKPLFDALVFKGARVLNLLLGTGRRSVDLDCNLSAAFVERFPDRESQQAYLQEEINRALRRHFEQQEPVRYELGAVKVQATMPKGHPMGWDAFYVKLRVNDLTKSVRGLPALDIDVAAPEELLDHSISTLVVGGHPINAYTLERITGEKLRAFLSSLPTYQAKINSRKDTVRARDLYDLCRIQTVYGLEQIDFWRRTAREFRVACRSRYVDCLGMISFQEQWVVTRQTYEQAPIPKDIPFEAAEQTLVAVVRFLETHGFVPFRFPLPGG